MRLWTQARGMHAKVSATLFQKEHAGGAVEFFIAETAAEELQAIALAIRVSCCPNMMGSCCGRIQLSLGTYFCTSIVYICFAVGRAAVHTSLCH